MAATDVEMNEANTDDNDSEGDSESEPNISGFQVRTLSHAQSRFCGISPISPFFFAAPCSLQETTEAQLEASRGSMEKTIDRLGGSSSEARSLELQEKPGLTAGITFGAVLLFVGLGRLPAVFWLIFTAAFSVCNHTLAPRRHPISCPPPLPCGLGVFACPYRQLHCLSPSFHWLPPQQ